MQKQFGQALPDWTPPPRPVGDVLTGQYVQLERMDPDAHAADLFRAYSGQDQVWDYLSYGPLPQLRATIDGQKRTQPGMTRCFTSCATKKAAIAVE